MHSKGLLAFAFLVSLFSISATTASAQIKELCTDFQEHHGIMNTYRFYTNKDDCFLSVLPYRGPGVSYRSYLFTKNELLIFNSLAENGEDATGARVYYFFPRGGVPTLTDLGESIQITLPDGKSSFTLKKNEGYLETYSHGTVVEDRNMSADNQGGVQITARDALILDSGWMQGNDPTSEPKRRSIFYDGLGKSCRVVNNEIFTYYGQKDVMFKFTDAQLKIFLATKCPQLTVRF